MSLAIRDTETVPGEGWIFLVEQTGVTISIQNYYRLYPLVVEHCQSNNIAVPTQQTVIDYLCEHVHVPCYDAQTKVPLINKMGLPFVRLGTGCCMPIPRKEAA